ncbi:hypothetical protein RND61_30650 [Streptomyces sp. TRM76323]|uniref:Integral membrane protein n=1 Tax=Streptomyces tamarix TaxID=3078565 RepID=A0ABU3QV16_9ACTN|nr:hypothetical protein [Streptomyces tamarix]MDT9686398.1 hypothetical protein [Streptomyces tamarix]
MFSPDRTERLRGQLDTARRRLDTARSHTGRVATAAGAAVATAGLFTPEVTGESLVATVVATGAGLVALPTRKATKVKETKVVTEHHDGMSVHTRTEPTHQARTASVLYAAPGVSLMAVLVAERLVPGVHWGEALAVALWSAGTWWLRPARAARHMLVPPLPPVEKTADLVVVDQTAYEHPAAQWWAERAAVEGGAAPGTLLEDVERTGESAMRAVIRSAIPGEPVPDISVRRLSALMDVPEDLIAVGPVPGRGASVRLLTVGTADEALDARTVWATRIAPLAMPGATITDIQFGRMTAAVDMTKEIDA